MRRNFPPRVAPIAMALWLGLAAGVMALPLMHLEDAIVDAPDGWSPGAREPRHIVLHSPDPEIEDASLSVTTIPIPARPLPAALDHEVNTALRGRRIIRRSPQHGGRTLEGTPTLAQIVISDDRDGDRRYSCIAIIPGIRRAVVVHFESTREHSLSSHYGTLRRFLTTVRFGK